MSALIKQVDTCTLHIRTTLYNTHFVCISVNKILIIIFFVCMAKLQPLVHITPVCILLINNLSYIKQLVTSLDVFHKKPLGNRYLHFVYSYRTNRNISDLITVFNVKNQNINNDGNSHLLISCLCIQGEALAIKRQWKREMKPITQKVNV